MFPLILNPNKADIIVIGNGEATTRRLALLDAAEASYNHYPEAPSTIDHQPSTILFAADFDEVTSAKIYQMAKQAGCLVNVEDKRDYCDFHVPAMVRRGELLLTISTGGGSPRLARRLRMMLEQLFPESWADNLKLIATKRSEWKASGASFTQVAEKTDELLDDKGWLEANCACLQDATRSPSGGAEERSDAVGVKDATD